MTTIPTTTSTTVVIADDQAMVRGGFRALLDAEADLSVVAEASDGQQALAAVHAHHPDVVLMDIRMPVLDGLEATRHITADPTLHTTRVLVLTTFDLDEYIFGALHAGASGFLLKGMAPTDLIAAVRTIAAGDVLLAPLATRRLIDTFVSGRTPPRHTPNIRISTDTTDRELEVLALLGQGLANTEIADQLFISPFTVKTHVSNLLAKHAMRDRVQLAILAYESGLIRPSQ